MARSLFSLLCLVAPLPALLPAPARAAEVVVAIGASNTSGFGVGEAAAYPARLEEILRGCGRDVQVVNAGVPFETTNGMLSRIDSDVPDGTRAVIIQPGGNDRRFFVSRERRAANIAAMTARLHQRGIPAIVYDPVFPPDAYQWDHIHLTAQRHALIAQELAPQVGRLLARGTAKVHACAGERPAGHAHRSR
ncbi:GDSL-type esterase/lipase family protein [Enterovirga sp.]|uniref:GDSL-type esterase/lipase family protein n=1 Tax=Enterovirga sp. TaxID=2026350 RepID=UPI002C703019|nr:GDSL-type esterase/lipase family protein [Enterovirga sp.]HMO31148.1 GDSL-type esterase/lipase family protein [Enterovirga sp.]